MAENAPYFGEVHVRPIGLHPQFAEAEPTPFTLLTLKGIGNIFKKRSRFAHKGTYGHALLMGGSWGKTGAVVLSAKAALRSGVGLLTTYIPKGSYSILQSTVPEAMAQTDSNEKMLVNPPEELEKYAAIGAGPGLGTAIETQQAVIQLIQASKKPLVLDADALNIISLNKIVKKYLPHYSILTPHPKEAERLFGSSANDFERVQLMQQKAAELQCILVLKGHHTLIVLPDGRCHFNTTGNAGMAKGGSGDVLTGIITSFLAQGYTPVNAALLGVYLHGMAGDLAAAALSAETMLPSDLIRYLSPAFKTLNKATL
jgi:NAD(P)H-hydrate epimerase